MNSIASSSSTGVAGIPEALGLGAGTVDPESGGEGGTGGQGVETCLVGWQDIRGGTRGRPFQAGGRAGGRLENAQGVRGSHGGIGRLGYPSAPLDLSI